MDRRQFLKLSGASTLLACAVPAEAQPALKHAPEPPLYQSGNRLWFATYEKALALLKNNVQVLPHFAKPVLIEGSTYEGIWQESGPYESLVYRRFRGDVARNGHMIFFDLQKPDGQLPADDKRSATGFGQIQMVTPIAATAWELAHRTGDQELLEAAYRACSRWDNWLMRYRNTRGAGLIEGFCTYDTGMDNSPRWAGMPRQCPDGDARKCPRVPSLPRLCPDLSATVYGGRIALSAMASALGKHSESAQWSEKAKRIRKLILSKLYVPEDAAFYDLDAQNHFVKVRSCALMRVCEEHVLGRKLFDELWNRQIHNPKAFWPTYPMPSIAINDPVFVRPIPPNSWGGASQALTALRASRWFDHYGRAAEFSTLMERWCEAIQREGEFRQQMDPLTGIFTPGRPPGYSPCALVMVDFTWRLAGVVEQPEEIDWDVRPGHSASESAYFRMFTDNGRKAEMHYDKSGATLLFNGTKLGRVEGIARLVTSKVGVPTRLVGIHPAKQRVTWQRTGQPPRIFSLDPNQKVRL